MKKRFISFAFSFVLILSFSFFLTSCGDESTSDEVASEKATEETSKKSETKTYGVGDTWEVDGQWKMTVDSVESTDERNEFEESDPAQVVVVRYHYENIGYEDSDGIMDGLYLSLDSGQVVDAEGNMCSEYPLGSLDEYAQETPVGAKCEAATAFGLKAEGNELTVNMNQYDGNGEEQKAVFKLTY